MDRQVLDARLTNLLHELERVLLIGQKSDLARDGDVDGCDEGREDVAEELRCREESGAGSVVRREGLGAAAVEVDTSDVTLDRQCRLDREFRVGRSNLLWDEGRQLRVSARSERQEVRKVCRRT